MRAFAVLMMVQGHTVDVVLSDEYRLSEYPVYAAWFFMRGMTAPIFLFTAGTVFTYLFRLIKEPFESNPRVIKGIKRFLLLVFLGYLLRYPTPTLIDFSSVSENGWHVFFAIDVLHLIGLSILFVIILIYIAEKLKTGDYLVFTIGAIIFFALYPLMYSVNWKEIVPLPVAGYLYRETGSIFPLFPWAGYCISGAILGSYLARNPDVFKTTEFSVSLAVIGSAFLLVAYAGNYIEEAIMGQSYLWTSSPNLIFLRLGFVLILNAAVSFISIKLNSLPKLVILVGRNTLIIYIIHLLILYGSAWNPGISKVFSRSLDVWQTVLTASMMIGLMIGMVIMLNYLKIKNKQLVTQ